MTLHSPLPPEECGQRLRRTVRPPRFYIGRATDLDFEIFGTVRDRQFKLYVERRNWRNSFKPILYGTLTPEGRGTAVGVRFRLHTVVRAFMALWFTGLGGIGGFLLVVSLACLVLARCHNVQNPELGVAAGPVLLTAGLGLLAVGRRLGRRDEAYLTEHLKRTLEA